MDIPAVNWAEISASMRQSLIIADREGNVVDYNESWIKLNEMGGVSADFDWRGVNLWQMAELRVTNGDCWAEYLISRRDDLIKGSYSFAPAQYHHHDGNDILWLLLEATPWKSMDGQTVKGLILSVSDISCLHTEPSAPPHAPGMKSLLPMCAVCKRIRDSQDKWDTPESYLKQHFHIEFTHDICPDCIRHLYPQYSVILNETNK